MGAKAWMLLILKPLEEDHLNNILVVENNAFSTPWSKEAFRDELANDLAHYLVAEID